MLSDQYNVSVFNIDMPSRWGSSYVFEQDMLPLLKTGGSRNR